MITIAIVFAVGVAAGMVLVCILAAGRE
jgi:hypothetical protein